MSEAPKKIWAEQEFRDWAVDPLDYASGTELTQYIRADIVEEMRDKLITASQVFRAYQAHHEAKGDMGKAERNKEYAWQMEVTLQMLEEPDE